MDFKKEYASKLISAKEAAAMVKDNMWLDYAWAGNTPVAFDHALAERLDELNEIKVRGGVLLWEPEIFKKDPNGEKVVWNSWHAGGPDRARINNTPGGFYAPLRYSELPKWYRENCEVNIAIIAATPMNKHGMFNFGLNCSHLYAVIEAADVVIIEVNEKLPTCQGGFEHEVSIDKVDYIIEGDNPDLATLPKGGFNEVDKAVARQIVEEIPNGATLQLGIGGMPNAVGLMIGESDLKDLGVHTEMYVDAFVELSKKGKINGSKKNIDRFRQVYGFAAGSQEMYDYMDMNSQVMAAPVSYTNDARVISQIDNFVSINSAVNVDLFGQVSSESAGYRHISGAGGQLDFVLGAYLSKGGKSFICLPSTYTNKKTGKSVSNIVPDFATGSAITAARPNTHWVVTEHGKFNCKGKSTWERAEGLINISAPEFRDDQLFKLKYKPLTHNQ
jgi:butyryl-CoA:acetate CoA-transferase